MITTNSQILKTLIVLTLTTTILGQFMKLYVNLLSITIPIYPADLIAGITTLFLIYANRNNLKSLLKLPGFKYWMLWTILCVLVWIYLIRLTSKQEFTIGISYLLRYTTYSSWLWLLQLSNLQLIRESLYSNIKYILTIFVILSFGIFIVSPDMRFLYIMGWDDHYYRLTGLFLDPGFTGLWILWTLLLWIEDYIQTPKSTKIHLLRTIIIVVCITSISLTFSRATYLSAFFAILTWSVLKKAKLFSTILIVSIITSIYLAPKPGGEGVNLTRTSTINYRIINYEESLQTVQISPIFGIGFNNIPSFKNANYQSLTQNHSSGGYDMSILTLLTTTGAIGTFLWLMIWKQILFNYKNFHKRFIPLIYSFSISIFIHGFFHNSWFYIPNILLMSILGAFWVNNPNSSFKENNSKPKSLQSRSPPNQLL